MDVLVASRKTIFCAKFCHLGYVIHNNFVTLDHFYVTLDQHVTILVTLNIDAKDNFSTSRCGEASNGASPCESKG